MAALDFGGIDIYCSVVYAYSLLLSLRSSWRWISSEPVSQRCTRSRCYSGSQLLHAWD